MPQPQRDLRGRARPARHVGEVAPGIVSYPLRRYLLDQSRGKHRTYVPHIYGITFTGTNLMNNGDQQVQVVDLDPDAPFLFLFLLERDQEDQAQRFFFNGLLQIRYGGSGGKAFARTDSHIGNICGRKPTPYYLPAPALLSAGTRLHGTLTALQAGQVSGAVIILFGGLKVFGWGGGR